jgi:hypothetical protein
VKKIHEEMSNWHRAVAVIKGSLNKQGIIEKTEKHSGKLCKEEEFEFMLER